MQAVALLTSATACIVGLCLGPPIGRSVGYLYVNLVYAEQMKWATGKILCGQRVESFATAFKVMGGLAGLLLPAVYFAML